MSWRYWAAAFLAGRLLEHRAPKEARVEQRWGVPASPRVVAPGQPVPKGGGIYKVGEPYQVDGQWHTPREQPDYDRTGIASYYAEDFHGRRTSNGEVFDMWSLSAAHPTLPLPSYVYVTNLENGRTLLLRVNDRGPYVNNRVIDVSRAAARYLGFETARHAAGAGALCRPRAAHRRRPQRAALPGGPALVPGGAVACPDRQPLTQGC